MKRNNNYLKHIDSIIAAVISFIAVYLFTKYNGVGISPDSIMYVSAARDFHDQGTLNSFANLPIVDFPVGYPLFLGVIFLTTGIDPVIFGAIINGLLFALLIFFNGLLISKLASKALIYKWLLLTGIILSQALLQVYSYLWSETLFTLLVVIFFFAFSNYLQKKTITSLIIAALVASIATITRYAGVTLIATGGLLLLFDNSLHFKNRWKPILIFSLTGVSLLALNLIRNRILNPNLTGPREKSVTSFADNLSYFGKTIANWFTINDISLQLSTWLGITVFLILVALLISGLLKRTREYYILLPIAFALIYGLFIVVIASISRFETINNRLLAPMYSPLLISMTWWIAKIPIQWQKMQKWLFYISFSAIAVWIEVRLYQIDYQRYDDQFDYGNPGYTDDTWKESGLVNYLKKHPEIVDDNIPDYSDANEAVYFFTGKRGVKLLPHRYFKKDIDKFFELQQFYLIWFKDLDNPELINLKDVQSQKNLQLIGQFNDGAIYKYDSIADK